MVLCFPIYLSSSLTLDSWVGIYLQYVVRISNWRGGDSCDLQDEWQNILKNNYKHSCPLLQLLRLWWPEWMRIVPDNGVYVNEGFWSEGTPYSIQATCYKWRETEVLFIRTLLLVLLLPLLLRFCVYYPSNYYMYGTSGAVIQYGLTHTR